MNDVTISKFISLVLRHNPSLIKLDLDANGWVSVDQLIANASKVQNVAFTKEDLFRVVDTNDKKRFALNEDKTRIRASQGHSINVDLQLEPIEPPDILYHGTANKSIRFILREGINKMTRTHVHLSDTMHTAEKVGKRHGEVIVIPIKAKLMHQDGFKFYKSENNVWLTDSVPTKYFDIPTLD